jgi:hypothetical protein
MVAEITGQPLSAVKLSDELKWGAYWQDSPPALIQIRDILANLTAMVAQGLGDKNARATDYLPKQPNQTPKPTETVSYFMKQGAEITYGQLN